MRTSVPIRSAFWILLLLIVCQSALAINPGLGKHRANDYPWSGEARHPLDAAVKAALPKGSFLLNLGPTGLRARIYEETPTQLHIKFVFQDKQSPARGKINAGDIVVGANGKTFAKSHIFGRRGNRKGWDGPLMELAVAIEDSQGKDGKLNLIVWPGGNKGQKKTVTLQLEAVGRFSKDYPWNCPRSEKMLAELCDFIASEFDRGNTGRVHTRSHCLLALMASDIKKHERMVKSSISNLGSKRYDPASGGFVCWTWGFNGVLLGEYYHRYKDKSVIPAIRSLGTCYLKGSHSGRGAYSHKSAGTGQKKFYASIGGISGLAMTAMSLFKTANLPYPEELYHVIHQRYVGSSQADKMNLAYNLGGIEEPPYVVVKLVDPSRCVSPDGKEKRFPGGMKEMGKYEIVYPAPLGGGHNWIYGQCKKRAAAAGKKIFWWVEEDKKENIVVFREGDEANRRIIRNVPPKVRQPEPTKPFNTTGESMHNLCIGVGATAHMIGAQGSKPWEYLGKHCANTCANSYEHVFSGHGGGQLHGFWAVVAASWADKKKQRVFLDYLKSFLILSQTHNGGMITQPWNRDRPGGNGDPWYGPRLLPTATAAMLLSLPKKKLQIIGAGNGSAPRYANTPAKNKPSTPIAGAYGRWRKARTVPAEKAAKLEQALHKTLIALTSRGPIKSRAMKISFFKDKVYFHSVDDDGVVFKNKRGRKSKKFAFDKLSEKDVAKLSEMAANASKSKDLYALTGVLYERLEFVRTADDYFKKAGVESRQKFETFFQ